MAPYVVSAIALGAVTMALTFVLLRLQDRLPLNPQGMAALAPDLAANTAISFTSDTGWPSPRTCSCRWPPAWPWRSR